MANVFGAQLQVADAIREIRARGCTTPGVAELIVEYHGALHVLANLDQTQQLGEKLAMDAESELGAKMRELLSEAAAKEVKAEPAPVVDPIERAVKHVMKAGYSEEAARQIVAEHGADTVLAGENETEETSKSAGSPSVPVAGTGTETGSASNAAEVQNLAGAPASAAGSSAGGEAAVVDETAKAQAADPASA